MLIASSTDPAALTLCGNYQGDNALQVLFVSEQSGESWAEAWWSFSRFQHWQLCLVNLADAFSWPEKTRVQLLIADLADGEGAHELSALYPHAVRVLTVPDCRDELLLARFPEFHLFCVYPLAVNQLPALLQITDDLLALPLAVPLRQQLLANIAVPAVPPVLQQLQQLLQDPDAQIADVQHLLAQDPLLSALVLRLANSAYIGFNLETASLEQALNRLGLNLLYALLLVVESQQQDFSAGAHQQTVQLAERTRRAAVLLGLAETQVEQAFVLGLLHGLGQVVLAHSDAHQLLKKTAPSGAVTDAAVVPTRAVAALLAILWRLGPDLPEMLLAPVSENSASPALALWLAEQNTAPTQASLAALWQQLTPVDVTAG